MSLMSLTFTAGETKPISSAFKYLLIMADGGFDIDLNVKNYQGARRSYPGVNSGFGLESPEGQFTYLDITSANAQTIKLYAGDDKATYNRLSGNVTINGGSVNVANQPNYYQDYLTYGASYKSNVSLAANTPETVFTPGVNVNGAIVQMARFVSASATTFGTPAFLAKSSAPSSVVDGDVILGADNSGQYSSNIFACGRLERGVFIPAGKGLYFISAVAEVANSAHRSVLYKLLP